MLSPDGHADRRAGERHGAAPRQQPRRPVVAPQRRRRPLLLRHPPVGVRERGRRPRAGRHGDRLRGRHRQRPGHARTSTSRSTPTAAPPSTRTRPSASTAEAGCAMGDRDAELARGLEALLAAHGLPGHGRRTCAGCRAARPARPSSFDLVAEGGRRPLILQRVRTGDARAPARACRARPRCSCARPRRGRAGARRWSPTTTAPTLGGPVHRDGAARGRDDRPQAPARRRVGRRPGAASSARRAPRSPRIHRIPVDDAPPLRDVRPARGDARRCSTRSASRSRPSSSASAGSRPTGPAHGGARRSSTATSASATSWSAPTACAASSTGSSPTSATRWRTSAGTACGRGGSARRCRPAASGTREELLAAYEAAGGAAGRPRGAALVGAARHAEVGADLHHAGPGPPRRGGRARWSWPPSAAGSARTSGTCSGCCPGGPLPDGRTRRRADDRRALRPARPRASWWRRCGSGSRATSATPPRAGWRSTPGWPSNALHMVERELALGPAQRAAHAEGLASLGCADEAELAERIRGGRARRPRRRGPRGRRPDASAPSSRSPTRAGSRPD